jgi:hypothetical protein
MRCTTSAPDDLTLRFVAQLPGNREATLVAQLGGQRDTTVLRLPRQA